MSKTEPNVSKNLDVTVSSIEEQMAAPAYCDVCCLAFGSQEPRLTRDDKVIHKDCLSRML